MENSEKHTELDSYQEAITEYEKQMQHGLVAYMIAQSELQDVPNFVKEIQNRTRFSKNKIQQLKC
ncbi:MAG: hypothetical protein JJ895_08035 [Balneolaceae bacterium]|nr:hypothetical protein [Balneolaceae bacterium]